MSGKHAAAGPPSGGLGATATAHGGKGKEKATATAKKRKTPSEDDDDDNDDNDDDMDTGGSSSTNPPPRKFKAKAPTSSPPESQVGTISKKIAEKEAKEKEYSDQVKEYARKVAQLQKKKRPSADDREEIKNLRSDIRIKEKQILEVQKSINHLHDQLEATKTTNQGKNKKAKVDASNDHERLQPEVFSDQLDDLFKEPLPWNDDWLGKIYDASQLPPLFTDAARTLPARIYGENKGDVDMVMADVGLQQQHDKLAERLSGMGDGHNCLLSVGVSGCGKTTAMFGIAKKYFSLYFECSANGRVKQPDASAFQTHVLNKMDSAPFVFDAYVCARLITFLKFVEVCKASGHTPITPQMWLNAQLDGATRFSATVLETLCTPQNLGNIGNIRSALVARVDAVLKDLYTKLPDSGRVKEHERLYIFLDEAHVLTSLKTYGTYFIGDDSKPVPFLYHVLHRKNIGFESFPAFVAGTALRLHDIHASYSRAVNERIQRNTSAASEGVFTEYTPLDADAIKTFFASFVGNDAANDEELLPYYDRLAGRGRLTARWLQNAIDARSKDVAGLIAAAESLIAQEKTVVMINRESTTFYSFWMKFFEDLLDPTKNSHNHTALKNTVGLDAMARHLFGNNVQQTMDSALNDKLTQEDMIQLGIAMIVKKVIPKGAADASMPVADASSSSAAAASTSASGERKVIIIDEPLVWEAAFAVFDDHPVLFNKLRLHILNVFKPTWQPEYESGTGVSAENIFAFLLATMKHPGKHLLHLIRESNKLQPAPVTLPGWLSAELESIKPGQCVDFRADLTFDDVGAHFVRTDKAAIILPTHMVGPDLIFAFQLWGFKYTSINNGTVSTTASRKNKRTIDPMELYSGSTKKNNPNAEIKKRVIGWGTKGIVRVDAQFPYHSEGHNGEQRTYVSLVPEKPERQNHPPADDVYGRDVLLRLDVTNLSLFYDESCAQDDGDIKEFLVSLCKYLKPKDPRR